MRRADGTAVVASLDEWHQSFIPSRTGAVRDVVLDTCAGIGAQVLILLWWKRFGKGRSTLIRSKANKDASFSA